MKQSDSFDCSSHGISQLALANEGSRKLLLVAVQKGGVEVRDARSGLLLRTLDGMHTTPLAMQVMQLCLTLMLLVAHLANRKYYQKLEKLLKPRRMGTHLRVLKES